MTANSIVQTTKNLITGEINKLQTPFGNPLQLTSKIPTSLDFTKLFPSGIPKDFNLSGLFSSAVLDLSLPSLESHPSVNATSSTLADANLYLPDLDKIVNPSNNQLTTLKYPSDRHVTPVGLEPTKEFIGEYPYVQTQRSESGHITEVDNTPGAERILQQHISGTYNEMHADGSAVQKIVGDSYTICAKDGLISIEGKAVIHVRGDISIVTGGTIGIVADSGIHISSKSDIRMKANSIALETTGGDFSVLSSGAILNTAAANIEMMGVNVNTTASGNIETSAVNIDVLSSGTTTQTSTGDLNLSSSAKLNLGSGGNMSFKSAGQLNADATEAHWFEGTSVASTAAAPAMAAAAFGSGISYSLTADSIMMENDDDENTAVTAIQNGLKTGLINKDELNTPANTLETDSAPGNSVPAQFKIAPSLQQLKNLTNPTQIDNFQISPHYTIGRLSKFTAAGSHRLVAQKNLDIAGLGGNLQLLALNVLEPMLKKYPDMQVTSAFRTATKGKSQHELGMAGDMQFHHANIDSEQYFKIAQYIRDFLPYDQLLLEYKSTGTKLPWVHVSFNGEKNRKQVFTLYNNTTRGSGLIRLA